MTSRPLEKGGKYPRFWGPVNPKACFLTNGFIEKFALYLANTNSSDDMSFQGADRLDRHFISLEI
jgi:hypothetical protein